MKNNNSLVEQPARLPLSIGNGARCPAIIFKLGFVLFTLLSPQGAYACAACFGKSDSPAAGAMNMAIFTLLAIILSVLGCCVAFIFYLRKRSIACLGQTPSGI